MEQQTLSRVILGICAAAGVMAATLLASSAMTNSGGLFCSVMAVVFWLIGAVLLIRRPLFRRLSDTLCALAGLYLCLCLRLCLFDHISGDYVSFLSHWTDAMERMTLRQALATPIGDYNMPYLYLLLLISRTPVYDLYCIKLCSVLADVFLALAAGRLAALLTRRQPLILLAFLGVLLAPTGFLNSAYWGQCDSIYAALALWGLYFGLKKRPVPCLILLAAAFAFKLQALFLLPILAFLLVRGNIQAKHLPVFPAVFFGLMLPPLLAGRSFSDTFSIYLAQTNAYPFLSLNAPSFWSLIPNDYFNDLETAAVLLAGIGVLLLLFFFLPRPFRTEDLVSMSLIFTLTIPWLLPRMHERYFYLAEMLSILYVVRYPRRLPVAVILLLGGFLAYCSYLFGGMRILSNELVAAIYGLTLLYLIVKLLRQTGASTLSSIKGGNTP